MLKFQRRIVKIVFDVFESLGLLACLVFVVPLAFLRRFDRIYLTYLNVRFLLPRGFFASMCRASVDEHLGNHNQAAMALTNIVGHFAQEWNGQSLSSEQSQFLVYLNTRLLRIQLMGGQIENAAGTVLRANTSTGINFLPDFPEFDPKIAHIVRAGIAAGKLLDEGGLATFMVRQGEEKSVKKNRSSRKDIPSKRSENGATIIPFPTT